MADPTSLSINDRMKMFYDDPNITGGPGGTGGHVIQENGVDLTDRAKLNFSTGLTATDDLGNDATVVVLDVNSIAMGGDLTGTPGNATLGAGVVGGTEIDAAIKDPVAGTAGLRTLGTGAQQAAAGNDSRITGAQATSQKGAASGYASLDAGTKVPIAQLPTGTSSTTVAIGNDTRITGAEQAANKGAASGYAGLDGTTKVPIAQLPTGTTSTTVTIGNDSRVTGAEQTTNKGANNGYAPLDAGGLLLIADISAGSLLTVRKTGGIWPGGDADTGVRPTSRSDVTVAWIGADPSPAIVSSGTGGMLDNVDVRWITP